MKRYLFWIGDAVAHISLSVSAGSSDEAVAIVRNEFEKLRKPRPPGPGAALAEAVSQAVGFPPRAQSEHGFCEVNIDMPSSRFHTLYLDIEPTQITVAHIRGEVDEG